MNNAPTNVAMKRQLKRKRSSCQDCDEIDNDKMVSCDSCKKWSHFGCVGVGPEIQNLDWLCNSCKRNEKRKKLLLKYTTFHQIPF